jgi:electron-transferring-flavoprotein dehydrogenase
MGGTSAFHEGGDHVAVRTGKIAGRLAATGDIRQYNGAWQDALGDEFARNVTLADVVRDYGPADWDRAFGTANSLLNRGEYSWWTILKSGLSGYRMVRQYGSVKDQYRNGGYVQFDESEYDL